MSNEKCCEAIEKERCCDRPVYNVYFGQGSCCGSGDSVGTSDHDQLENRNLGIQHDASAIGFADGETFQEKYDKGELSGPQGEPGDGIESVMCGQVIGVVGTVEPKELTAQKWIKIKFIPTEGNISDINVGGEWVCPKDGIYTLSCYFGVNLPKGAGDKACSFVLNSPVSFNDLSMIGLSKVSNENIGCPNLTRTIKLSKGDNVSLWYYAVVANTINNADGQASFAIILDSSIDITAWNLYETWKEQDSCRVNVSFDGWIETLFRPSEFQELQDKVDSLEQTVQDLKTIIEG